MAKKSFVAEVTSNFLSQTAARNPNELAWRTLDYGFIMASISFLNLFESCTNLIHFVQEISEHTVYS